MGASGGRGLIIVDSSVPLREDITARTVAVPILETAAEAIGKKVVANMVALGVLGGLSKAASPANLEAAVRNRVPKGTEELNLRALQAGLDLARVASSQRDVRRAEASDKAEALEDARKARRGKDDGRYR
jgi:Pyruvate/2-oxoacid:ferredoxin oxidoreductase gamma subunit